MDNIQFPLEVLQIILSYLSFYELKSSSLVCHRWNQAAGALIARKAKFRIAIKPSPSVEENSTSLRLWAWIKPKIKTPSMGPLDVIQHSTGNYQTIIFTFNGKWLPQKTTISACVEKYPPVKTLHLECIELQCFAWLYETYHGWMALCETLHISLLDRFYDEYLSDPSPYIFALPNLKNLVWKELSMIQKRVTIEAANLETVHLDHSQAKSALIVIPHCDKIKHMSCTLRADTLTETFTGYIDNIRTMCLNVLYSNPNIDFLPKLNQLHTLNVEFLCQTVALKAFENMKCCTEMKSLRIVLANYATPSDVLSISTLLQNFPKLKTLTLVHINIDAKCSVQANNLVQVTLDNVTLFGDGIILVAPILKTLSLSDNFLSKLSLINATALNQLNVRLTMAGCRKSLQDTVFPFIETHDSVMRLTLFRGYHDEADCNDVGQYQRVQLKVQSLELQWLQLSADFFRMISEWKSLQSLIVKCCIINCAGLEDNKTIRFPTVNRMILEGIELSNTTRSDIPLAEGTIIS